MQKKRTAKIHDQSGSTLVEIIVSLVVAALIMAAAGNIMVFTGKIYRRTADHAIGQQQTVYLGDFIKKRLQYACYLEVRRDPPPEDTDLHLLHFSSDGVVSLDGTEIFGTGGSGEVGFLCSIIRDEEHNPDDMFAAVVTQVNEKFDPLYSDQIVIKLINLKVKEEDNSIVYHKDTGTGDLSSKEADIYLCYRLCGQEETE